MSNDLSYSVGVDPTDLNTGVAAVEARLQASGQKFEEMPRKYQKAVYEAFEASKVAENEWEQLKIQHAQQEEARLGKRAADSAAVFEAEFARQEQLAAEQLAAAEAERAAEQKLAAYRADVAFARMTNEEKLAVIRQEALVIQGKLQSGELKGVELANTQLQYEQKKSAIYDLNAKIAAETAATLKDQTAEVVQQPGLLGKIQAAGDTVKKTFASMGVELKGIGIGVVAAAFTKFATEAIQSAQKLRDENERMGKPIDAATRSMAALGDALGGVKAAGSATVGFLVGGFTQLGDLIGSGINRLRGISEAQENIAVQTERAANAAEARVAKLKEEQHDVEKVAAARQAASDAEAQAAFAQLSAAEQLNARLAENFKLREQLRNTEKDTLAYYERQKALTENLTQLHELDLKLREEAKKKEDELAQKVTALKDARRLSQEQELELFELQRKKASELTAEEQSRLAVLRLQSQEKNIQVNIDQLAKKGVENLTAEEQNVLALELEELRQVRAQIDAKKGLVVATEAHAASERKVTAEIQTQLDLLNQKAADDSLAPWLSAAFGGVRGHDDFASASDEVLKEIIRRDREAALAAFDPNNTPLTGPGLAAGYLAQKMDRARYEADAAAAQAELDLRASLRSTSYGDALRSYQGDPTNFDSLYSQATSGFSKIDTTNQKLEQTSAQLGRISSQLAASGLFPTI